MLLLWHCRIKYGKITCLICIIFIIIFIRSNFVVDRSSVRLSFPLHFLLEKSKKLCPQSNYTNSSKVFSIDRILLNLTFSPNHIYHHDGVAYDYYSITDLKQSKASCQWKIWPLPNETNQEFSFGNNETSPFVLSKLPFVDVIYVITDDRLTQRHDNIKKAFRHQGISIELIKWRKKWDYKTCNSNSSHSYVYQRLNLKDKPLSNQICIHCISKTNIEFILGKEQQRRCALAMKHVDIWYEMAEQKVGLGLILEDDAIFVPFFKEKFIRMIYAAINYRTLRINGTCTKPKEKSISDDEWIDQNPMIVIGSCLNIHSKYFEKELLNASPILTTHKSDSSRCTHAYLLTSCSAQSLVDQIQEQKNDFWPSDFLQNNLFRLSRTLQSFWLDPPLSYQGNQVIDLDNVTTFDRQTYM